MLLKELIKGICAKLFHDNLSVYTAKLLKFAFIFRLLANTISHMKALTNTELQHIAETIRPLVGAQLQEVQQTETEFGLGFYNAGDMEWLWFDLDPREPMLLVFHDDPPLRPKLTKPLLLFTRAHFVGHRLKAVEFDESAGRILRFEFSSPPGEQRILEARLYPHGQNLLLTAADKTISWAKVNELTQAPVITEAGDPRDLKTLRAEWLKKKGLLKSESKSEAGSEDKALIQWQKTLDKKSQALGKIQQDIESKDDPGWREAGEWIKANNSLTAPAQLRDYIDAAQSLSWNIKNIFEKAKANERKIAGSRERYELLKKEIETLKARGPEAPNAKQKPASSKSLLEKADARGRKLSLSEDLEAYIGKNAADNLSLLRRAAAHDIWLHLRDYPGAHAIVRRGKNRKISDKELNEIGKWVVLQSLKKSESELSGGRYDMIIAECRFVKPIKGDKLGRVTYQNDRLFVVRL
jgi:predicted ribosome quality control (RQC) complex YloA/Tae2 family protein